MLLWRGKGWSVPHVSCWQDKHQSWNAAMETLISHQVKLFKGKNQLSIRTNCLGRVPSLYLWRSKSSLDKHMSGMVWAGDRLMTCRGSLQPYFLWWLSAPTVTISAALRKNMQVQSVLSCIMKEQKRKSSIRFNTKSVAVQVRDRQLPICKNQDIPWFFSSWSVSSFNLFTLLPPSELLKKIRKCLVPHKQPLNYCDVKVTSLLQMLQWMPAGSPDDHHHF